MPFAYPTVEIGGKSYKVLADVDTADEYLAADPSAAAWTAGDAAAKAQWLVIATRILGRQSWQGDAIDELAFPRANIPGVDPASIPLEITQGTIELASAIAGGYDAANQSSTASGVKRQKAGTVEIEYFYGAAGGPDGQGLSFPLPVWELIARFLAGAGSAGLSIGGAISSGTCEPSSFEHGFGLTTSGTDDNCQRAWD